MNTREAFEAWVMSDASREIILRDSTFNYYGTSKRADGRYWNSQIARVWPMWQACAAWAARECVKAVDAEHLAGPVKCDSDTAYDAAIGHAAQAIRAKFPEAWK